MNKEIWCDSRGELAIVSSEGGGKFVIENVEGVHEVSKTDDLKNKAIAEREHARGFKIKKAQQKASDQYPIPA